MTSLSSLLRAVLTCTKKYSRMGRQAGAGWQVTQKATERIQFFLLLHFSICVRNEISKNEECHLQQLFQITRNPVYLVYLFINLPQNTVIVLIVQIQNQKLVICVLFLIKYFPLIFLTFFFYLPFLPLFSFLFFKISLQAQD